MALSRFVDEIESAPSWAQGALPSRETATCDVAWNYEVSTAARNAVFCSRRAGKTFTGRRRAIRVACSGPKRWVHVVSLIRRNAKKHWWNGICASLHELGWRPRLWAGDMILRLENGSFIQALGIDDEADVKRLQGDYSNLIIGDEAHLPNDNVQKSFFAAAVPMLADYGGAFDWLGLPPDIEPTEFSAALDNPNWAHFHWGMLDHDHPEPAPVKRERVEQDLKQRGLTWESPEAARTYLGKRVRDPSKSAYEYQRGRNDYDPASGVDFSRGNWLHSVGLDLGFQDRDAVVVLAWRPDDGDRHVYARFIWQRNHLSTDSLASVVGLVAQAYRPMAWTGDTGGHGAVKVLATLMERLRISIAPKPPDVLVSLGYVNDDLRTGRLLLPTYDVETDRLAEMARRKYAQRPTELAEVLGLLADSWSAPGPELAKVARVIKPGTLKMSINPKGPNHSDVSEALRYAHAGAQNWLATQPEAKRKPTMLEREEAEELQERLDSARDVGRSWYQRQAGRSSGAAHRLLSR